jgi:hypothetical protein
LTKSKKKKEDLEAEDLEVEVAAAQTVATLLREKRETETKIAAMEEARRKAGKQYSIINGRQKG